MIYYISDLHLFHDKIIKKYNRPFSSIEEMHDCIIKNWRNTVKKNDIVYVLGDLGMYHAHEIADIISSLPGNKILITGNHDSWNLKHTPLRKCFKEISIYKEIIDAGRRVVLFHYPLEEWNGFYRGFYHVHGHVHDSVDGIPLNHRERRYNACVEFCDYRPMTLDQLMEKHAFSDAKEKIDYDALACVIMDAYESDRAESGRKEIVKGMKYTLQKYQTAHDREIIDDMLMNFTGYTLETLMEKSIGYDYSQYDELEDFD